MNTNKAKAALFALVLFVLGAAVGALAHRYYTATAVSAKTAEDFRHKYISEMQTKLNLTPHQVTRLQLILDDTKQRVKAVRETYHPEMEKIKDAQIEKVKSILSPAQAKQYEALVAEREQHAREQDEHDRQEEAHQHELHLKALNGQ